MNHSIQAPAPRPCASCPYRRDVPSGIWSEHEYAKLPEYDRETFEQPHALFQCHQNDAGDPRARVCAGWVAVHGEQLLALRIAVATNRLEPDVMGYTTDVPVHESGQAAADHGRRDIDAPKARAVTAMHKIERQRESVSYLQHLAECSQPHDGGPNTCPHTLTDQPGKVTRLT